MVIQTKNMVETNIFQYNYQLRSFHLRLHLHRFPELLYVMDGYVRLRLGDMRYKLYEGDFVFIHPMQIHGYHTFTSCNCVVSAFPPSLAGGLLPPSDKIGATPVFRCSESVRQFFCSTFVDGEIDGIGMRDDGRMPSSVDKHNVDYSDPAVRCRLQSCLMAVLGEYLRTVPMVDCPRDESVVVKLFLYLNDHFQEDISLSSTAAALGYSANYLSHCIQKTSSMNFPTALASFRIEHARQLMRTTEQSNLTIALESGFGSERSFQRMFRRLTGLSPTEYRQKQKSLAG
ncbi:MAG: helix-turn-helix transcriptional regulator [Clostridia bacterium]|nr:helix-turn-helix transcriptional regulator [Clostridia bacterium]